MRTFYTNREELFACVLEVDGAPLSEATARIIIEVGVREFIFDCVIDVAGNCTTTIPALETYDVLGFGIIKLEVNVEDVVFYPYTDTIEVLAPTDNGYSQFMSTADYDGVDLQAKPTWTTKKVYSSSPYIVLPNMKFNIAIGDTKPDLKFFVFKLGEQFGDPIPLPNMVDYDIIIKIYDYNCNFIAFGPATSFNQSSGEITYTFSPFDFIKSGIYFFEVEFTSEETVFTLPETNIKNEIIVRD